MIMFLIMATAAGNPATAEPLPLSPLPVESEARGVMEWQLGSPPRSAARPGLSASEADVIYKRYLKSIGEKPDSEPAARGSVR